MLNFDILFAFILNLCYNRQHRSEIMSLLYKTYMLLKSSQTSQENINKSENCALKQIDTKPNQENTENNESLKEVLDYFKSNGTKIPSKMSNIKLDKTPTTYINDENDGLLTSQF